MVEIVDNEVTCNFVLLSGMAPSPSIVPVTVAVAHGEGDASLGVLSQKTRDSPFMFNPPINGSPAGIRPDDRVLALMALYLILMYN